MNRRLGLLLPLRRAWAAVLGLLIALLLASAPLQPPLRAAQPPAPVVQPAADAAMSTCRMGVYIEDLRDFNFAEKSLFAALRVWSVCPSANLAPLDDLEFSNANELNLGELKTRLEPNHSHAFADRPGLYWSERSVSGSFYYPWSARNFPFDRHMISFEIVPQLLGDGTFLITPDYQSSGVNPRIGNGDWVVNNFRLTEQPRSLGSSFGNPAIPAGEHTGVSSITASVELHRARITSFLKMAAGVFAASVISALAFYMDPREPDLVSGRTGLCVGCLFAAIVNMQQAESTLGISEDVTLTDQIHIVAIFYILASTVLAIVSYLRCERDQADRAQHLDRHIYLPVFASSYLVVNAVIVAYAVLVG